MNNIKIEKASFTTYIGNVASKEDGNDGTAILATNLELNNLESMYSRMTKGGESKNVDDITVPEWFLEDNNYELGQEITINYKTRDGKEEALKQIKEKEYVQKFRSEYKDKKVLAVAICYNSKTKEHSCKIEEIEQ